jgi:hypothetical protein
MSEPVKFNPNKFIKSSDEFVDHSVEAIPEESTAVVAKKSKRKSSKSSSSSSENVPAPVPTTSMSYLRENIPYATAYEETNHQLDESIMQLNVLGGEIVTDLQMVRNSKTLRNKYNLINDMTETAATIINSKISAIKEKNKTINDVNRLEMERMKQLKSTMNAQDDNARIGAMYDAFISTPIGVGPQLAPSMQDMMTGAAQLPMMPLGGPDQSTGVWEENLTPAQNRMVLDAQGKIETVVMYDPDTGNRWYEVLDKMTGQPVPNVEKPDDSHIYDLDLNIRGAFAKDSNRNTTYRLVTVGGRDTSITEY